MSFKKKNKHLQKIKEKITDQKKDKTKLRKLMEPMAKTRNKRFYLHLCVK